MQKYKEFSPTQFDRHINFDDDREDWLIGPCSHNRDSDMLTKSNWVSMIKELGGESETVEIHRFGHWGNGWFEIVLIQPGSEAEKKALEIESALADYSVLDDSHYSEMEAEAISEYWNYMSLKEKIDVCKKNRVSIFAARRDYVPEGCYDSLMSRIN